MMNGIRTWIIYKNNIIDLSELRIEDQKAGVGLKADQTEGQRHLQVKMKAVLAKVGKAIGTRDRVGKIQTSNKWLVRPERVCLEAQIS